MFCCSAPGLGIGLGTVAQNIPLWLSELWTREWFSLSPASANFLLWTSQQCYCKTQYFTFIIAQRRGYLTNVATLFYHCSLYYHTTTCPNNGSLALTHTHTLSLFVSHRTHSPVLMVLIVCLRAYSTSSYLRRYLKIVKKRKLFDVFDVLKT